MNYWLVNENEPSHNWTFKMVLLVGGSGITGHSAKVTIQDAWKYSMIQMYNKSKQMQFPVTVVPAQRRKTTLKLLINPTIIFTYIVLKVTFLQ